MAQLTKSEYKDCCGGKGFHRPSCVEMLVLPMGEVFESLQRVRATLGLPDGWLPDVRSKIGKRCREYLKATNEILGGSGDKAGIAATTKATNKNNDLSGSVGKAKQKVSAGVVGKVDLSAESVGISKVVGISPKAGKLKKWLLKHPDATPRQVLRSLGRTFSGVEDVKRAMEELR